MGSDLQLTGLASGFDWKPVVEQLVELEAIPKKRLQSEKSSNEGKISDLGLLKSQLDTLNGASKALSNEDLYDARKITLDSDSAAVLSASAAAGTLTGTYKVEVVSLASNTQMTSENRIVNGLGNSLQSHLASTPLSDLPLQSDITAGTFSIGGRTFNITDLSMSLQDLIDEVNNNGAGFDPEKDGTYITLEYDTVNDRMIIDGGDISTGGSPSIPILGSPTDTSNFLQVMRLLNRTPDAPRLADYESWSGISIYTGNASKAWVRPDDQTESPGQTDDRIYTAYDPVDIAGQSNKLLYRRKESTGDVKFLTHRNKVSTTALNHAWDANSIAYQDGFLFKLKSTKAGSFATDFNTIYNPKGSTPPASATSSKLRVVQGNSAPLTHIERNGFWELGLNLEGANGNVDTGQAFGEAVASHNPTNNTSQYKQGDIVNAGATFDASNGYFRAVKDRALAGGSSQDWNNYETSGTAWASEAGALWQNNLPVSVYSAGRMFKINAGLSAFEHTGNSSVSLFTTGAGWNDVNKLVVGNNGVAGAKSKYFRPKETAWDAIETNKATFEAGNDFNWTAGAVVQTNSKFYKATGRWDNADPSAPVANKLFSLKTDNATHADGYGKMWVQDSYVQDITHSDKDFYKAEAAWGSVSIHTGATTINNSNKDDVVLNNSNKEFYQAKGNFTTANISIHQTSTLYKHFDPSDPTHVTNDAKLNDRMVEDGTTNNFYTAGVNWANTTNFTAGGDVTAFNASNFVKIGTNFYDSQTDFTALPSHSANNNFNSGVIVKIGTGASTAFYKAKANVASVDGAGASFLTAAQVIPMISDTRVLDNTGGVVYKASANLANLENFDATAHTTYKTAGIVVNNGGTFYESTSTVWSDVENTAFTAGTSPTAGLTANTSIVRLNTTGDYYKIKGDWGNSSVFPSASAVNSGTTVKDSGGIFYKLDQDFLGDTSSTRTPSGAGEWVKDATSSKYYRSKGTDDSSSILDTTKWDEFADFNAAVTAGLATDVDDNVKLNTPPAPSNDFWEKVTDDLTPSPTNTSGAWTTTLTNNSPTDLTNTHYWNPYADATDPSSNPSSNAIWENVTDKANLTAPPAGTANDFWADVTTAATTLTGGGLV